MRTGRTMTVRGDVCSRGLSAPGGRGMLGGVLWGSAPGGVGLVLGEGWVCCGGVSAPGGGVCSGSVLGGCAWGVCARGCLFLGDGSALGGWCLLPKGGVCSLRGGVYSWGVCLLGGVCFRGMYHMTYPIMHLMLPVCCLHVNWDSTLVQLLIYCWPIACWDITTPPLWTEWMKDTCKNITFANYVLRCGNYKKNLYEHIFELINWTRQTPAKWIE